MIKIGIIEDDEELKELLENYLGSQSEFKCVASSESVEKFLNLINETPDIILSDIGLPGMSGIEG